MAFGVRVLVKVPGENRSEWHWLKPGGKGRPRYSWLTFEEAKHALDLCYPLRGSEAIRVEEIPDGDT